METIDLARALWRKSSRSSANGQCVEMTGTRDWIALRDSKHPTGPALIFTPAEWDAFIATVQGGGFTHP